MPNQRGRSTSPQKSSRMPYIPPDSEDDSFLNTRQLEAFGRTVQATASQLMGPGSGGGVDGTGGGSPDAYRHALSTVHRTMRRPMIQRSVFSFAKANPRELIRSNFNTYEIEQRALTHLPDELLRNVPVSRNPFSLLEGFKASFPDEETLAEKVGKRRRRKMLEEREKAGSAGLRREKDRLNHRLEMMGIRKTMCASEIKEIDDKISNLHTLRKVILDRLAGLEQDEHDLEHEIGDVMDRIELVQEEEEEAVAQAAAKSATPSLARAVEDEKADDADATDFMSESIYEKLPKASPSPSTRNSKRRKALPRKISMPVLHEHMESGSQLRQLQAHNDMITALDFDAPFGTMVTAALDDTVRVWDLNAGRCMGMLEGHLSSVRCLQVEDNLVATGSMDASIRLWDLGQANYHPPPVSNSVGDKSHDPSENTAIDVEDDPETTSSSATGEGLFTPPADSQSQASNPATEPPSNSMEDCHLFTLEAHVAEVTAIDFRGNTLVSGSADKTLRQWDLEKGRCVQTLDVLWAAAQASTTTNANPSSSLGGANVAGGGDGSEGAGGWWRPTSGRLPAAEADFVGALQVFDAALACGTADGMVRLWDLRSGMVHRSLVGHTGPVTALQFDDVFLVTGSRDRSVRIWDLRTGTIHDAFAYDNPITSLQFDTRRIVAAAGEDVVKVYDKTDGKQWDCGAGAPAAAGESGAKSSIVERVRIKDGYLVEGRKDGVVGVWSC